MQEKKTLTVELGPSRMEGVACCQGPCPCGCGEDVVLFTMPWNVMAMPGMRDAVKDLCVRLTRALIRAQGGTPCGHKIVEE